MKYHQTTSFYIIRTKHCCVEVRCWPWSDTEWAWNVYGYVFETHPLFNEGEILKGNAPLHGGCTFDEEKTTQPIGGPRYRHQEIHKSLCVGSDYRHDGSPDLSGHGPSDGIPSIVLTDAKELADYLESYGRAA